MTRRKQQKPPVRVVKMKLELDLIDAIEVMAKDSHRNFYNMIDAALRWACWSHSNGRSPDHEMCPRNGGPPRFFADWDEKIRAKREARVSFARRQFRTRHARSRRIEQPPAPRSKTLETGLIPRIT